MCSYSYNGDLLTNDINLLSIFNYYLLLIRGHALAVQLICGYFKIMNKPCNSSEQLQLEARGALELVSSPLHMTVTKI